MTVARPAKRDWSTKRLSTGIYQDDVSIRAIVSIAAGRKQKRFEHGTSIADIKRWRNEMRTKLERLHPQQRAGALGRGTFGADMKRYIEGLAIDSWKSRRSELRAWEKRFGAKKKRARVTQDDARKTIKAWKDAGVPPKTILNRCRALTAMYYTLDGRDAWTPLDNVDIPKPPRTKPPFVPADRIVAVERTLHQQATAGTLKDGWKWRARYMVLNATGMRPVHVKRAEPEDVDLALRTWRMEGAKGGEPIEIFLNDEMMAAWEAFIDAKAWGTFDPSEYADIVRAAGWPAHVRPYAAKHSVGRELGERGVDLQTIADWYGHTDPKTTRIYVPVLNSQLKKASLLLNGRLGWVPKAGVVLPRKVATLSDDERNANLTKILEDFRELLSLGS